MEQESFYKRVYDELYPKLFTISYRITKNVEATKDIIQDTIIDAVGDIEFETINHALHHFINGVRWRSMNYIKRVDVRRVDSFDTVVIPFHSKNNFGDDVKYYMIKNFIDDLPNACRDVMVLLFFGEMDSRQAAKILNLKVSTVKNQKARGLNILREKFNFSKEQLQANNLYLLEKIRKSVNSRGAIKTAKLYNLVDTTVSCICKRNSKMMNVLTG